ncbi:hypothetical protein FRC09_003348 [Ceratobasidium sp. 395]|nr:hypothetical protein FRC09_003348 [Ceratobasidium sp. 395]
MFENSESVVAIVLYFAGHSSDDNLFELHDGQLISEITLFDWIDELRKTTGKHLPVLLVFDFCRESTSAPKVSTDELEDIYVIWACTPGESSYDVNIDEGLPYSDLLKVFCLTLHKMRPLPPETPKNLMRKIATWASRIIRIKRGIACGIAKCPIPWNECPCLICLEGKLCLHQVHCPEDRAPIQTPVAWFSGFGNDIDINTALDAMQPILRYVIEPVRRAAAGIIENRWYEKFVVSRARSVL